MISYNIHKYIENKSNERLTYIAVKRAALKKKKTNRINKYIFKNDNDTLRQRQINTTTEMNQSSVAMTVFRMIFIKTQKNVHISEDTYRVLCLICLKRWKRKRRYFISWGIKASSVATERASRTRTIMSIMEWMVPILVDLESSAAVKFCL